MGRCRSKIYSMTPKFDNLTRQYLNEKDESRRKWLKRGIGGAAALAAGVGGYSLLSPETCDASQLDPKLRAILTPKISQNNNPQFWENMFNHVCWAEGKGKRGKPGYAYKDSRGKLTIGIGYNITGHGNDAMYDLQETLRIDGNPHSATYNDLISSRKPLTEHQMVWLYRHEVSIAYNNAIKFLPDLSKHPDNVQLIIIDMSYNMGIGTLKKFVLFQKALVNHDYVTAAKEMKNSRWYTQTGRRARKLHDLMQNIR